MNLNEYDIFIKSLCDANSNVKLLISGLNSQNNNTVKTFEDCAKIEQDIINRLDKCNPFR